MAADSIGEAASGGAASGGNGRGAQREAEAGVSADSGVAAAGGGAGAVGLGVPGRGPDSAGAAGWLVIPGDSNAEHGEERVSEAVDSAAAGSATVASDSMVVELSEWAVVLTPSEVLAGPIALHIRNNGERPHTIEVRSAGMRWRALPIPPGGATLVRFSPRAGEYVVASTDSAYVARGMIAKMTVKDR